MKIISIFVASCISLTLVACGGGGGGEAAPVALVAADKYVGTWTHCEVNGTNASIKNTLVFTKTAAASLSYTAQEQSYTASTLCAGVNTSLNQTGSITIVGTKTIASDTVEKIDVAINAPNAGSDKDIALITGATLKLGDDTALDANGYPTTLDNAFVFTKQ